MGLTYKIDVLAALHEKGITTYRLRKERLLSESTVQKLRTGQGISWDSLEALCQLLQCQPGDLLSYEADDGPEYATPAPRTALTLDGDPPETTHTTD